jgi:hypothetical protein
MDISPEWRGDASEALVASDLLRNEYNVAYPHGHQQKYDLIVDAEFGLFRVQVKTAAAYDEYRYEMEIDQERYPEDSTDIFAGAIHEEGEVMYVPFEDMTRTQRVNYRPPDEMGSEHHRREANLPADFTIDAALDKLRELRNL